MTALVVVVYVTLLRPEGPSTISGIEAPDGGALPRVEAPEKPGKPRTPPNERRRRRGASSRATPGPAGGGVLAATGEVPPGAAAAPPLTPPGDQYTDTVEALLDRVSGARMPGQ